MSEDAWFYASGDPYKHSLSTGLLGGPKILWYKRSQAAWIIPIGLAFQKHVGNCSLKKWRTVDSAWSVLWSPFSLLVHWIHTFLTSRIEAFKTFKKTGPIPNIRHFYPFFRCFYPAKVEVWTASSCLISLNSAFAGCLHHLSLAELQTRFPFLLGSRKPVLNCYWIHCLLCLLVVFVLASEKKNSFHFWLFDPLKTSETRLNNTLNTIYNINTYSSYSTNSIHILSAGLPNPSPTATFRRLNFADLSRRAAA